MEKRTKNRKRPAGKSCRYKGRRTRNKNLNGPNLRIYRGKKVRKGKRRIRRKRYPLQPQDIVSWKAERYIVKGTHSYGYRVRLKSQAGQVLDAPVSQVTPLQMKSGIYRK